MCEEKKASAWVCVRPFSPARALCLLFVSLYVQARDPMVFAMI